MVESHEWMITRSRGAGPGGAHRLRLHVGDCRKLYDRGVADATVGGGEEAVVVAEGRLRRVHGIQRRLEVPDRHRGRRRAPAI